MRRKKLSIGIFFLFVILSLGFISSYISSNVQYSQYTETQSENINADVCQESRDFLIQVAPFGCTPSVVRTDLLEETDVPVYCQLGATIVNPLIEVEAIDSISFSGTYPKEISGIGFHPAKAALGVTSDLNSPVLNNIGYVVLILKKQANASAIPDFVTGNLTAKIKYNINNAFGIGKALFYLPQISNSEWESRQSQYSFWGGRGSLRADNVDANSADITLYSNDAVVSEVSLKKGETSDNIYLPGFKCQAGLKLKLDSLENPDTRARLRINSEVVEVAKGEKFLDNKCQVQSITKYGLIQKTSLKCQEDTGSKNFDLMISPKVLLIIDQELKEVGLGDWLYDGTDSIGRTKSVYLGYIGTNDNSGKAKDLFVYLYSTPNKAELSDDKLSSISSLVGNLIEAKATSQGLLSTFISGLKLSTGLFTLGTRYIDSGEDFARLNFGIDPKNSEIFGKSPLLAGFAEAQDIELTGNVLENYQNAKTDYDTIRESYSSEKSTKDTSATFGEEALYNEIILAWDASQKKTAQDLCKEFEQTYPNSNKVLNSYCNSDYQSANVGTSSVYAMINKQTRQISFDGIYEPNFEEYGVRVMVTTPSGGTRSFDLKKNQIQYLGDTILQGGKEILTLPGGTLTTGFFTTDLYFTYTSTSWMWSADKTNWMYVSTTKVTGGIWNGQELDFSSLNRVTVQSLVGKTYDAGRTILVGKGATSSSLPSAVELTLASNDYIQLVSLDDTSAGIRTSISATGIAAQIQKEFSSDIVKLTLDSTKFLGEGYSLTLSKINLKKAAKVSVIPNIDNTGSQANFSFKIGIEKRAINLPPEKIKEIIAGLDKEIKEWNGISDTLNGTISTLKKTCIATGAVLVATNFIANAGGTGIARKTVMRGTNGWYEKCTDFVAKGTYSSQQQCLNENSDKIDNDVEKLSSLITAQNSQIKQLESGITTQKFLTDSVVDTDAFIQKYAPQVSSSLSNLPGDSVSNGKQSISKSEIISVLSYEGYKEGKYTTEQLRNIELYTSILSDSSSSTELKDIANSRLYSELSNIQVNVKSSSQVSSWAGTLGVPPSKINTIEVQKNTKKVQYQGLTNADLGSKAIGDFTPDTPIALIQTVPDGKQYILVLDNSAGTSQLTIKLLGSQRAIYNSDGILESNPPAELTNVVFEKVDASSYKNAYKNAKLRYYETAPYKGMPAIVPFDLTNGWYAAMKQTLSTGSNIQSYDASARVNSFYLCNVGANGLEEFQTIGDDTCEMINTGTGQSYNQFPGLSETDSKSMINKAVKAIEQASKLYKSGLSGKVKILDATVDVGSPAVDIPDYECQDFMSPKECSLLFNLCDPVICPSSRCDLGGAYPVSNVVQSGIIGSLVLCLPNINEGIIIPVCLTGIKAGIDSFVSVKQSYKDCLQESLDTGKLVGICDEIYSIYLCDFFWRQALPLADLIIPKVMEFVVGQNVKGGGEYLSVSNAWSGAEQAIDYFVNNYGVNSKEAFLSRSSENVGEEVCKLYTSAVYPSGGEILDSLTAADSPSQFTGRFDETSLTTVTSPPTSQYKVYYHIYAGKDSGAYYKVYLKGSLDSSYYKDTAQSVSVASGYVTVGGYASETKDFIATSGYNQLCINVNGQEECGFKEVTTSFALNYIEDQYLSSQANETDITTESECISGTASAYSLLNLNAQSAAEEIADPEIYNEGIIRICATNNPGTSTDPYVGTANARWKQVGYCDNEKIKCWIDTNSVEDVIKTTTVENATLNSITQSYLDVLTNEGGYLTSQQFSSVVKEIEDANDSSTKITMVGNVLNRTFWGSQKAQLLYIRGNAYADIFRVLFSQTPKPVVTTITSPTSIITTSDSAYGGDMIWATAKGLVSGGLDEARTTASCGTDTSCISGNVCARFVIHVLINAGVNIFLTNKNTLGTCSQDVCTLDSNGNMIFNSASHSEWESILSLIPKLLNSGKFTEVSSDALVKGDIVVLGCENIAGLNCDSGRYDTQHVVIFDSYSSDKTIINVYGDPGQSGPTKLQSFTVKSSSSTRWYIYRSFRYIGTATSTTSSTSSTSPITTSTTATTIGEKIAIAANTMLGSYRASVSLVSQSLTSAGISVTGSSADSLISSIRGNSNFVEVDVTGGLKRGDIILLGSFCSKTSMGIFSGINSATSNPEYYGTNTLSYTVEDEVKLRTLSITGVGGRNTYAYTAYRYVGDYSSSEKAAIRTRSKWTLSTALTEVNSLLKNSGKTNGGKYSDNQAFSDQLVADDVLTKDQCATLVGVNTLFGLVNTEKDMNWLKKTLLENQATSGQAESVSAD